MATAVLSAVVCAGQPALATDVAGIAAAVVPQPRALHATHQSTRFVIGLERKTEFQVFSLGNPNRVIVELPDVKMQLPLVPGDEPVGLIRSFRGGQVAPGQSRVVIDVMAPVVVEKATMEKGPDGKSNRLVIDIVAASPAAPKQAGATRPQLQAGASALGASGVQPPLPRPAERPQVKAAKTYKPVIVLDPGHGGHDSGATKNGAVEKDVVLAFGRVLRDKLEASGRYKVLMTRDNDSFVELDERREFAERSRAALFIAIHADYANTGARGATIYSLRETVAEELQRSAKGRVRERVLAAGELKTVRGDVADGSDMGVVKGFLADLAQREVEANMDRTNVFAHAVIENMSHTTSMKDNPDRSAAFIVLKTAQMPAVLIELAYVTNAQDAQNLKSDNWRGKVTESILTAIDNYFSHQSARLPM